MFRKNLSVSISLPALMAAGLFISSCGGGHEEGAAAGDLDVEQTTDTISSEVRVNFDLVRSSIPKPAELTTKLNGAKINYNKGFLLSSSKSGSFSSNYQKAIGMGAFGADLSVSAAYNQPNDALEYLTQISKLATDLGIGSAFDPEFGKELLSNVSKPDTFQLMLDKAYEKAERNLRSNARVAISVLMVSGGWVESLYLSVEGLNTNPAGPKTGPLYNDIASHCYAFNYIYELLTAYKSNADCAKLLQEMEQFKPAILGFSKQGWGAAGLPKLRETITALRGKVVG